MINQKEQINEMYEAILYDPEVKIDIEIIRLCLTSGQKSNLKSDAYYAFERLVPLLKKKT